jgi:hypothetical protein
LPNRGSVTATIDATGATEEVAQGERVLSKCARGALPDGHVVSVAAEQLEDTSVRPPIEAVVTFAPTTPICILRVDGEEVAPREWPVRQKTSPRAAVAAVPWFRYFFIALGIALMVVAGVTLRWSRREPPPPSGAFDVTHRAANGLFVAHFPSDVEPRQPVLPSGVGGVVLEDRGKTMSVLIAAKPLDDAASRDPWALQQDLHKEALANLSKGATTYEETSRREDTCHGKPGAVVTGSLMLRDTRLARIWSCAFVSGDAGYLMVTTLAEPVLRGDDARLRSIVDATELTRLADVQGGTTPDRR